MTGCPEGFRGSLKNDRILIYPAEKKKQISEYHSMKLVVINNEEDAAVRSIYLEK